MTAAVWAQAFPGGVADAELQHLLARSASGQVVAVRLADGQVLWRSAEVLRPLLLGHGLALGLAPGTTSTPARVVALALHEAGAERWRSAPLPWPEWAGQGDAAAAASEVLHAGWLANRIVLRWHLQPLYRGGAAPGPSRVKAPAVSGTCLLDMASGALHGAADDQEQVTVSPAPQEPSDDPSVIAQQVLGGVRYSLRQVPVQARVQAQAQAQAQAQVPGAVTGMLRTTLTAHDPVRGLDLWHCLLDEAPRKAPRALRS